MRKITRLASEAFTLGRTMSKSNTVVTHEGDLHKLYLHGNLIAEEDGSKVHGLRITLAGWNTPTTRERLKAVGVVVCQRKGEPYIMKTSGSLEAITENEWVNIDITYMHPYNI